jgi:hypothetical protein
MFFFLNLNILCIFWSTGFVVWFFSCLSSVQIFGVDRFNDRSNFDNIVSHGLRNMKAAPYSDVS